jgi:uncharacterized GH25 family protein
MRKYGHRIFAVVAGLTLMGQAIAHDIWVEANQSMLRIGESVSLSLMLGNHGNQHRDFRLASKIQAGQQNLSVISPDGKSLDLTSNLIDNGYEPKEGFWGATFQGDKAGIYQAVSTFDQVMSYAPVRDIKCAKTYFALTKTLDSPPKVDVGFQKPIGAPLELVPVSNPLFALGVGTSFSVKLLYKGNPLKDSVVSFIPKGVQLSGEIDSKFEAKTDEKGVATVTLDQAGQWLIAAHVKDLTAAGAGYKSIGYSATIHLRVPNVCPCCVGEGETTLSELTFQEQSEKFPNLG